MEMDITVVVILQRKLGSWVLPTRRPGHKGGYVSSLGASSSQRAVKETLTSLCASYPRAYLAQNVPSETPFHLFELAVLTVCSHAGKFYKVIHNDAYGSSYMPESAFIPPTIERNRGVNSRPVDKALHTGLGMPAA